MADQETERKTQYAKGFEDAIEGMLLVLSVGIDMYPGKPSEETLLLMMDSGIARRILDVLLRFERRLAELRQARAA